MIRLDTTRPTSTRCDTHDTPLEENPDTLGAGKRQAGNGHFNTSMMHIVGRRLARYVVQGRDRSRTNHLKDGES